MEQETGFDRVDADVSNIFDKIDAWVDGFFRLLPNIGVAIVVMLLFWGIAWLVARAIDKAAKKHDRDNLGDVGSTLVKWTIIIAGLMLAVTIVIPSIKPADLFAGLGIGSVAIGFAFKDILQNMLAGILILIRQPFEVGDQIVSGGHEGTVERIETRATLIRTYDGRRVVVPNSDIYTDAVVVNTAFDKRRSQYDVQIGCSDDFDAACEIMTRTIARIEGVLDDPAPEAIPWSMDADGNTVRIRWWTNSQRSSLVKVWGQVIRDIYNALNEAGVDLPYPTRVLLLHDQTEAGDGDRSRQREGWPAAKGVDSPAQDRMVDALRRIGTKADRSDRNEPDAAGSDRSGSGNGSDPNRRDESSGPA